MSETVNPVASSEATSATAATPTGSSGSGGMTAGSTVPNDIEKLKAAYPELWQKIMEGIAMDICKKMERHQDDLKRIMREARRNSGQA